MTRAECVAWYARVKLALLDVTDLADDARVSREYADALAACVKAGFRTKAELREAARRAWESAP